MTFKQNILVIFVHLVLESCTPLPSPVHPSVNKGASSSLVLSANLQYELQISYVHREPHCEVFSKVAAAKTGITSFICCCKLLNIWGGGKHITHELKSIEKKTIF